MKQTKPPISGEFAASTRKGVTTHGIKPTLLRFLIVSSIGVLVIVFVTSIFGASPNPLKEPLPYILSVVWFNLLSEGNIIINRILDLKSPWFFRIKQRGRQQLGFSLIWAIIVVLLGFLALPKAYLAEARYFNSIVLTITFGFLFVLIFNAILFLRSFLLNWKLSVLENESLKQAKLEADYKILQNQLNPHFLFNNFSVLISEIHYNPQRAAEFTQKLADVYRYMLQRRNDLTVTLKQEMELIDNYVFLHKIRVGEAIQMNVKISDGHLHRHIPPFSLYVLLENAIKHNRASEKMPLTITIESLPHNRIKVSNNLQPKSNVYSTGTGLTNNSKRYELLSGKTPEIEMTDTEFTVVLPLLESY